jgi:hypothetical protein
VIVMNGRFLFKSVTITGDCHLRGQK